MNTSQPDPQRTRVYNHHHLNSTRWNAYAPRDDDIIITTSYKSGTTWMQSIVRELIVASMDSQNPEAAQHQPLPGNRSSPWVDVRWEPLEEIYATIEAQQHRRFLKSHLPLDALPYYPQVRYLVVGRDPRDVFMSLWNHYLAYTDHFYAQMENDPERPGPPCPRPPDDIHEFWAGWISRGWFAWEQEGYPFWGNMYHTQSYWDFRHLDNLLFVHYNDLLADPAAEIRRIAQFLGIALDEKAVPTIVAETSFATMKERAIERDQTRTRPHTLGGGAHTFFHKGTNGRWHRVLTDAELAMYKATKAQVLTPECAHWLEQGRAALADNP